MKGIFNMKIKKLFGLIAVMGCLSIAACNPAEGSTAKPSSSGGKPTSSQSSTSSSTAANRKSVSVSDITLTNEDGKAYVKVTGTANNYAAGEFRWAWGLKVNGDSGEFVDGKATPAADDYKAAELSGTSFSLMYNLTDLELTSGAFYQVYGGTPESYGNIPFTNTAVGARDATRSYYLRTDENNSIVFDSIQPIKFTKAAIVNIAAGDLPTGVTAAGPYVKFGGVNEANLTEETIDEWNAAGKIAGNFQRVIMPGDGMAYSLHNHVAEERFWAIEGEDVFFYTYIGFIEDGEGWMTHFDCVSGNSGANLQFDNSIWGGAENTYTIGADVYRVYADNKSHGSKETEFWGCLGITRNISEEDLAQIQAQ